MLCLPLRRNTRLCVASTAFLTLSAWTAPAFADLTIGSPNVATADPVITAPYTTPCTVTLFDNQVFADFSTKPFDFAPPATCPGPWQKVVLSLDYYVTVGVQFDRTAEVWIGQSIIYFGTTQEPSAVVSPSWHIDRDVTDLSALFTTAQSGHATLGNVVDSTYTGVIYGSATLNFYPEAPTVFDHLARPDVVAGIAASNGSTADVSSPDQQLAATFLGLPTNIERAFLDVYAQSQGGDEFWYFNLPDDIAPVFQDGGGTAFRETEVLIDDVPAGVAPIFPWIYTGGVDPLMWRPTPGVQTLSFEPYRVDLTPFAGILSDGQSHTIALYVFNTQEHFSLAANLLLYLDHGATTVSGSVTQNTLAAPTVNVDEDVPQDADGASGTVTVTSNRQFSIAGTLNTSHGVVTTQIEQTLGFSSAQDLAISNTLYKQNTQQLTTIDSTTTRSSRGTTATIHEARSYPLTFNFIDSVADDGAESVATSVDQEFKQKIDANNDAFAVRTANLDNRVVASATRHYGTDGNVDSIQADNTQSFTYNDSFGACYGRTITSSRDSAAVPGALESVTDAANCGTNQLSFFDAFYNYASAIFGATVQLLP